MSKPKFYYVIASKRTVAHAHNGKAITVQQADPLDSGRPDSLVFLSREEAVNLNDALSNWLRTTA